VVALSASHDRDAVLEMLRSGASGYVVKGATVTEILEGIRGAARGEAPLSSAVAPNVVHELSGRLEQEAGEAERRDEVVRRIRAVMEQDRLAIVFQPIFDIERERVVGAEALSRFEFEPRRGPDEWFAEAASVGLGADLELWAVRTALRHLHSLPPGAFLSVNLSPDAVRSGTLAEVVPAESLERTVVEITEHAPVADYEALAAALRGFRTGGGRVAIDDAGAGFASLRHIVLLAPDIIKLDISLTRDIHVDRTRRALAAALISFARETGKVIVAEGVERKEELDTLRQLGVAQAQGYHLARPVPPEGLEAFRELSAHGRPAWGASA
jgi:EAL domain-containing protein (putative c-di-GMP-specific phosphodiesterase class I)